MGAGPQGQDGEIISSINVTPLVDVTLVLLIVFMVTASYIVKASINVQLPKAQSGDETAQTMLTVLVKQQTDGPAKRAEACDVLALDGVRVQEAALIAALGAAFKRDAETKVMISADEDCRHSEFVHVVDLVKAQGITKFAINIEAVDQAEPASPSGAAP